MKKKFIFTLIAILIITLGGFITARASVPAGIEFDPADEGYCEAYGIEIDATQVEAIYLHPETVLANPETFLGSDSASLMLAYKHAQDAGYADRWSMSVKEIAAIPIDDREQQIPYILAREILAGQETFCKIAGPHILSYLPEWAEKDTTFYLVALDTSVAGETTREGIVMSLSHPHFALAEKLFSQGSAPVYNSMVHELFHHRYWDAWLWQTELPLENWSLRDFVSSLQNEGMAVNATSHIWEYYPSSLDVDYPLRQFQTYVRYWIGRVNKILENAPTKTAEELYPDLASCSFHCKYIVGGYMAARIEDHLGRETLVDTVETGPMSFIQTYNSVADKGMEIHFVEPEFTAGSVYQDLRTSALEGDIILVGENLDTIRSGQTPLQDFEVEGHLMYTTGYILLKKGALDLAEEVFQALIAIDPQVAAGYHGLGDVYAQKGETSAAIEHYERALELNDHNQWVKVIIAKLNDVQE